jgi:hypothetical protein
MWGLNRFTRPGWVTGFLVTIACLVGIAAGVVVFREGKKIKKVEGIPVEEQDVEGDAEKGQEALGLGTDGMEGDKSKGEKGQSAVNGQGEGALDNGTGGGERPGLTRKTTEKTKGKYWYERH